MSQANIDKLERVQNILVRVGVGAPQTSSSLNIRRDLHWLPVGHRITYKLCLTTWKTVYRRVTAVRYGYFATAVTRR